MDILQLDKYAAMQRFHYDAVGRDDPEDVVGHYDYHENVPYETQLLFEYGDVRKPIFSDFSTRKAFDIGCGEGRMIRRMRRFFAEVDGADISEEMARHARDRSPGSTIYVTSGQNVGQAPSSHYDFAYCTISLQHICVHATRDAIIRDLVRILKPDGKITLQLLFSRQFPFVQATQPVLVGDRGVQIYYPDNHHARWFDNKTTATSTNSGCDVVIGPHDLDAVKQDFLRLFQTVELWFYDISIGRSEPRALPDTHPNSHINDHYWGTHFIFVHCTGPRGK